MNRDSDTVLERLSALHPKIIDLSLGRIERLLAALGHPQRQLPPVVHVAGTNGKGSVIAYLRAMLEADGRRVHVYTSPHLVRFHERIRLAGALIDEAALLDLLLECEAANGKAAITFFEITTAAAMLAFARVPADILLMEVGLGGRLDATNVVDRPLLSVLTPVSMDHMQYLGNTLEAIAFEKAGILKSGVTAVVAAQPRAAGQVIERQAQAVAAPLIIQGRDFRVRRTAEGFELETPQGRSRHPQPGLFGAHQIDNAATAVIAARRLGGLTPSSSAIDRGLQDVEWPARLQRLTRGRLVDRLAPGWELWVDGGHNEAAGAVLAEAVAGWPDRPLHLVYGMLNTKAAAAFLRPLAAGTRDLRAVAIPREAASLSAAEAAQHARSCGIPADPADTVSDAIDDIIRRADLPGRILVCGSLYLAGSVLAENG